MSQVFADLLKCGKKNALTLTSSILVQSFLVFSYFLSICIMLYGIMLYSIAESGAKPAFL